MSTVLVLTVGTTAEPLLKAVEDCRAEAPDLSVYLLYGRPFPGQKSNPFDVATQVRKRADELGVRAETREVPDPEDVDACLQVARSVLREVASAERVVVDFTGGTKPLSAALVHAALTEPLAGQLVFEYTGGQQRDAAGRVLPEAMRPRRTERTATDDLVREVLDLLGRFAYREALLLSSRLPQAGRAGFLRQAVAALYAWDEFDYEGSAEHLRRVSEAARCLLDAAEVAPAAELCRRLLEPANALADTVRTLRKLEQGSQPLSPSERLALLVADALENASRRLAEGRPTDSVLRAYRAVECAVQVRLLASGVNPWHPDWAGLPQEVLDRYRRALARSPSAPEPTAPAEPSQPDTAGAPPASLPRELALTTGLTLLQVLDGPLPDALQGRLRDLQSNRNRSYLEHGYRRVGQDDAQRLLAYAEELCQAVLRADVGAVRTQVTHKF